MKVYYALNTHPFSISVYFIQWLYSLLDGKKIEAKTQIIK